MGQINERRRKNGSIAYTAQVRRKKGGKTILSLSETFDRRSQAEAWLKRKERELLQPEGLATHVEKKRSRTLRLVVEAYIEAHERGMGRSKLQNLRATCRFPIAERNPEVLTAEDFVEFARDLLRGVQPAPLDPDTAPLDHYDLKPRLPQTVAGYMSHLGVVVRHGGPLVGLKLPKAEFLEAMDTCRHSGIVGSSAKRTRRPTLQELDALMEYFVEFSKEEPRAVPMHMIVLAAIFLTYRQGEHTRLLWDDLDELEAALTIRDMKHPRRKAGNNVEVQVVQPEKAHASDFA